MKTYGAEG